METGQGGLGRGNGGEPLAGRAEITYHVWGLNLGRGGEPGLLPQPAHVPVAEVVHDEGDDVRRLRFGGGGGGGGGRNEQKRRRHHRHTEVGYAGE